MRQCYVSDYLRFKYRTNNIQSIAITRDISRISVDTAKEMLNGYETYLEVKVPVEDLPVVMAAFSPVEWENISGDKNLENHEWYVIGHNKDFSECMIVYSEGA